MGGAGERRMSSVRERRRQSVRGLLAFLAVSAAFPGLWATLAPASFYGTFPLGGGGWVAPLGPISPHFIADVGAFYLAFAGLFAWAAWRPSRDLVAPLCVAWMTFSTLHFGWHLVHLEGFSATDAVAQMLSLGLQLALPALTIWLVRPTYAPAASQLA